MQTLLISELLTGNVRDPLNCVRVTSDVEKVVPAWLCLNVGRVHCSASAGCCCCQIFHLCKFKTKEWCQSAWCKGDISVELGADEVHIKNMLQNAIGQLHWPGYLFTFCQIMNFGHSNNKGESNKSRWTFYLIEYFPLVQAEHLQGFSALSAAAYWTDSENWA